MQNDIQEKRNLLTIGEASEYLSVSIDTLRRWEKKGRIEAYRSPGGHRHYDKEDLDKLFNKKYIRDEPTQRTKGPYTAPRKDIIKNESSDETSEETAIKEKPVTPKYNLPAWRAFDYKDNGYGESIKNQGIAVTGSDKEVLDRPVREIKIPEVENIKVVKENLLSADEAYYQQQNTSVLTPPMETVVEKAINEPIQLKAAINSGGNIEINRQSIALTDDTKKLIIYVSLVIGLVLLALGWYYLWLSSQRVLSPIP